MRFGKTFNRRVGAGTDPLLGSDAAPTGIPSGGDNQFDWKSKNIDGFPIQRICVGYRGPGGALALTATLYAYDDLTNAWYKTEAVALQPGALTWLDCPTCADSSNGTSAGAINVALVVAAAGGDPAGQYQFIFGADLSAGNANSAGSGTAGSATAANQVAGNASLTSIDGKLPAAAAPADAETNASNASNVRARTFGFNGATWDRLRAGVTAVGSTFTGFLNALPFAVFHTAPGARTDGQGGPFEADAAGNLRSADQFQPGAEDNVANVYKVEQRNSFLNVNTSTTAVVKSGAGFLHSIALNNAGVAGATVTVYDNTAGSGTIIAKLTVPATLAICSFTYDVQFSTGLTVVTTGATPVDITVCYR